MSSRTILLALVLAGCAGTTDPVALSNHIAISPQAAVVQVSQYQAFAAFYVDSAGHHLGPAAVKWTSSLTTIARIDQSGVVSGAVPGATLIRAVALNGAADSAQLVVIPNLEVGDRARGEP